MRLNAANLSSLAPTVARPGYDRDAQQVGIVHFGIGAFHRAHQAWYADLAMEAGDRDWAIVGVSLRSGGVADQLNPQDGLYTLTECSGEGRRARLIGAVRKVLLAPEDPEAVIALVAAPATQILSFTITEKGYCRTPSGDLDPQAADDHSVYRYLQGGLALRRAEGLAGLTLMSCDNLAANGRQLARLVDQHLRRTDPELADWVQATCTFPSTMVDRIVPATTADDRRAVTAAAGLMDEGAVLTEPFSQWVIEDRFAGPRPRWEEVGASLVADVDPYERAKLRLLNGAHSFLAYAGLLKGHAHVHDAMGDPDLAAAVRTLMLDEAAPTLSPAPGQDLAAYAESLIARFANPALNHRLIQIAMDGSQKIPQRWLETLAEGQKAGRPCPVLLRGLAAWLRHVRGDNFAAWGEVSDPLAAQLAGCFPKGQPDMSALFGPTGLVSQVWTPLPQDLHLIARSMT